MYKFMYTRSEILLERALYEKIVIPLPVLILDFSFDFSNYGSGIAAFGVVEIGLGFPPAVLDVSEEGHLGPGHADIPVLPDTCRVVTVLLGIRELIPARGIEELRTGRERYPVRYPVFPQH